MLPLWPWLLSALWTQAVATGPPPLPHVEQYQVVWPQRLTEPRARRSLPSHGDLYPDSVSYVLGTEGHNFTLHLRKNRDLLGSGYTETYLAANGSEVSEQLQEKDHCFYQGHVEGHQGSAASISICAGLRGFFQVNSTVHLIEPLDEDGEQGQHAMYQAKHLQQKAGTCGVNNTTPDGLLGPWASAAFRSQPQNWPRPRGTRYVELYVVTDSREFQLQRSREAVRSRVLEVVNHVDKFYQQLNLRVVLVGLEMWSRDKIYISSQIEATLENFLSWRAQDLMRRYPHDNAQLITGIDFSGVTVGLAKVSAICTKDSGAVNQDHSVNALGLAATMAHEMGHNLGLIHDEDIRGCYCPVPKNSGNCIMTEALGNVFPRIFSRCSKEDLERFMQNPQTNCLVNVPNIERLASDPVCGNLLVERGEQCDCGSPQDCRDPCCNPNTCQLVKGAECAHGACCHACKVKPAGHLCRPRKDSCDLEEFCDGRHPSCPEDSFQENGTPCPGGYCFNGDCPTLTQQCQNLWGPGAWVAPDTCFSYLIPQGCNGQVRPGRTLNPCGTLFCTGGQKPPERSSCAFSSNFGSCQAISTDSNPGSYEMVRQGTKCGEGQICWDGRCQGLHVYRSKDCSAKCHNHGVCNHKKECQCSAGWAPPYCTQLLADVHTESRSFPVSVMVVVGLLVGAVFILTAVVIYRKPWNQVQKRSVAPKPTTGLSNPVFHMGGSDLPVKGRSPGFPELDFSSQAPRPTMSPKRPPPVPPAAVSSVPLPVPVCAQQEPDQISSTNQTAPSAEDQTGHRNPSNPGMKACVGKDSGDQLRPEGCCEDWKGQCCCGHAPR